MRKKFFLFIIAAFMATSSAWELSAAPEKIDAVPMPNYLQNMTYDANSRTVTFDDQFHVGTEFTREYQVRVYDRDGSNFWAIKGNTGTYYIYGDDNFNSRCIVASLGSIRRNSSGGSVTIEIGDNLDQCYSEGSHKLRVFIVGWYVDPITSTIREYVKENALGDKLGTELTSYVDVDIPSVKMSKIRGGQYNTYQKTYTADNGDTLSLRVDISGVNQLTYSWERSHDNGNTWTTCPNYFGGSVKNGDYLTANDARNGQTLEFQYPVGNGEKNCQIRLAVEDSKTKEKYYSSAAEILFRYAFIEANGTEMWYSAGQKIKRHLPQDCHEFKFISDLPVEQVKKGDQIEFTMPACDVQIEEVVPTYTVKFWNSDLTHLKTEEVVCGGDATAPEEPTMQNLTFDHWSADFTNVHRNLNIYARYTMSGNYSFDAAQIAHTNKLYPADGFADSETRAMMGDSITFWASLATPSASKLYYQTARRNAQGEWIWNGSTLVGEFTAEDVAAGKAKEFTKTVSVFYNYYNEQYLEQGFAFRFMVNCGGESIFSEVYEYDVYYPLYINSLIDDGGMYEKLMVENTAHDIAQGAENLLIPARYQDTIHIYRLNGGAGACMNFARVNKPQPMYALEDGLDGDGNAYVIAPGEKETLNVNVAKVAVIFDGATPTTYYDFTSQGLGYKGNAYYAEVVNCGGSIRNMPADPANGQQTLFIGWKAWGDYADDAYLNVPATGDPYIGFTAQWEDIPVVPQYKVRFYGKDGSPLLLDTLINEGENAVPPVAPEVSGYHFVGWDKPYTTITADVDITALYGEDSKTWTVTYYDADKTTKLGEETVNDGEAAQGIVVSAPDSYHLAKWMDLSNDNVANLLNVSKDMEVYAAYELNVYTITYTFGKTMQMEVEVIGEELVKHGDMPLMWQSYESILQNWFEEEFGDQWQLDNFLWTPAIVPATQDATYDLAYVFSTRKFTVRFQNWDHTLLDEQQVEYGKSAVAPADPTREGYTFKGWDREFNNIIAAMTVTAVFEKAKDDKDTGIKDVQILPSEGVQKILHEGRLYIILPDGKVFNAQGVRVK